MTALLLLLAGVPALAQEEDPPPADADADEDDGGDGSDEVDEEAADEPPEPRWYRFYTVVALGIDPVLLDEGLKGVFTTQVGTMPFRMQAQGRSAAVGIGGALMLYGNEFVVRGEIPVRIAVGRGVVDVGGGIAWPVTDEQFGSPRAPLAHGFARFAVGVGRFHLGVQGLASVGLEPLHEVGLVVGQPGPASDRW